MTEAVETASDGDALSPAEEKFFTLKGAEPIEDKTPEAKPESKAETKPDAKAEADDPDAEDTVELRDGENKGRFVRHGAFHKERMQRKALETRLAEGERILSEERQKYARVDERLRMLSEAMQRPEQQQQETPPDPEQDIFGYVRWQAKQIEELKGTAGKAVQISEAQINDQRMADSYRADAARFVAQQNDFGQAYQFLIASRDAELQAYGITDPQERTRMIHDEERGLVAHAMKNGVSPAERAYAAAKARGYVLKAPEPEKLVPPKNNVVEQIESIQRGKDASKTLSSAGGSPTETMTAEALANMSEEDFGAYIAKLPRSQQRAMFGG